MEQRYDVGRGEVGVGFFVELRSGLRPVDGRSAQSACRLTTNTLQRATRAIYNEQSEVIYSEAIYNEVIQ